MANLRVIAEIKPAGDFPVVDAPNVSVTGGKRLDVALSEAAAEVAKKANKSEVDAALAGKANKSEVDAAIENKADKSALEATNASVSANTSNIQGLSTESTVLSARMDEFTKLEEGSTTGDAELTDGRVGADGKTYTNIGGAIRGQVTDLKSDLARLNNIVNPNAFFLGDYVDGKYLDKWANQNELVSHCISDFNKVSPNTSYVVPHEFQLFINQYTGDKNNISSGWIQISGTTDEFYVFTTGDTTEYVRFSLAKTNANKMYLYEGSEKPIHTLEGIYVSVDKQENRISTAERKIKELYAEKEENVFTTDNATDGKYLDKWGNLLDLSTYSVTDYIEVESNALYTFPHSYHLLINSYDTNKSNNPNQWVEIASTSEKHYVLNTGNDIKYIRISYPTVNANDVYAIKESVIRINPDMDIIGILLSNAGKTFYVDPGTYDIIAIYKNKYGNDYFENKSSLTGESIENYGLPLINGTKLICSPGAKFICHYTGSNTYVIWGFSGFACGNGYEIDGLNLEASNVKYAIHDDYNAYNDEPYNVVIKNSHIVCADHQAIGGGLGKYGSYEIYNNHIERTNATDYDMRYHNNVQETSCVMRFYNNFFPHTLRLSYYGASQAETTKCYVSNNYTASPIINDSEDGSATVNNMKVYAWNNSGDN